MKLRILLENGEKKDILMRIDTARVGDPSRKFL